MDIKEEKFLEDIHKLLENAAQNGPFEPKPTEALNSKLNDIIIKYKQHLEKAANEKIPRSSSKGRPVHPLAEFDHSLLEKPDPVSDKKKILEIIENNLDEKQVDAYYKKFEKKELLLLFSHFKRIWEHTRGDTLEKDKGKRVCMYITIPNLKQFLLNCNVCVDSIMTAILKPLKVAYVCFDNFLDCLLILHRYKPLEHGRFKLKAFAYLLDTTSKGYLTKSDLVQSIYYSCLNDSRKLDDFFWKYEGFLQSRKIALDKDSAISVKDYCASL